WRIATPGAGAIHSIFFRRYCVEDIRVFPVNAKLASKLYGRISATHADNRLPPKITEPIQQYLQNENQSSYRETAFSKSGSWFQRPQPCGMHRQSSFQMIDIARFLAKSAIYLR
ncbi:MAG: hypothetical protein AAFQ24_11315, partial [Pseudomonadota bacterium]